MAGAKRTSTIRILETLEAICASTDPSIAEISNRLKIPQPTLYRNVENLIEAGFLARDPSGRILPGVRLRSILFSSLAGEPTVTARRAILKSLVLQLDETVNIAVPQSMGLVYFDRVESHWPVSFNLQVGDRIPFCGSASGKLYLSSIAEDDVEQIFKLSKAEQKAKNTIRTLAALHRELEQIRKDGYALDNQEFLDGMIGAAVPIKNPAGETCAFLSTHALIVRKKLSEIEAGIPKMREAARDLEKLFFSRKAERNYEKLNSIGDSVLMMKRRSSKS
ncbi:MAG TPA: IclR family transcriptional regulator [Xanthobacteraceae bacterium]|nr:IclR family transcriptional regulator [Xanthobacteraceae bacterium]